MRLLGSWRAPTTEEAGLFEAPVDRVAAWFVSKVEPRQRPRGVSVAVKRPHPDTAETAVELLAPLTSVEIRRFPFLPLDGWTLYFNNSNGGTDPWWEVSLGAEELRCRTLRVVNAAGVYPATILELYGPDTDNRLNYIRTISAANDGGRWRFDESGERFEFDPGNGSSSKRPTATPREGSGTGSPPTCCTATWRRWEFHR